MKIKFEDIIAIQKAGEEEKAFAMRIFYEPAKNPGSPLTSAANINDINFENDGSFPTLKMAIKQQEIDETKYQTFQTDIIKVIIDKIIEVTKPESKKRLENGWDGLTLVSGIIQLGNKIAVTTRRGAGNFVLVPKEIYDGIKKLGYSIIGDKINGIIQMYETPYLTDKVIVGYKGSGKSDSGLILYFKEDEYQLIDIEGSENYYCILEV